MAEVTLIRVKSKGTDGKVLLHERDAAHPGGEAFLSNDGKVREVAETAAVSRLIGEGSLVKTDEKAAPTAAELKGKKVSEIESLSPHGVGGAKPSEPTPVPKVKLPEIK